MPELITSPIEMPHGRHVPSLHDTTQYVVTVTMLKVLQPRGYHLFRSVRRHQIVSAHGVMQSRPTIARLLLLSFQLLALAGCATLTRLPSTKDQQAVATIPHIPNARVWSDDRADALLARAKSDIRAAAAGRSGAINVLAISGGGSNGAYGAGLLTGWSARGTRPEFTVVTGASAGALISPFAFLGRPTIPF